MKLFIDIGNSRLKWAIWSGRHWSAEGNVAVDAESLADWMSVVPRPDGIWIACVSGEQCLASVMTACQRAFGITPIRVRTQAQACGVRCAYAEPSRLGVDRWIAIVAAFHETGGPAVVFDCGTAITSDAVTAAGEHLGGLIVPGIDLMRRALYGNTARILEEDEDVEADLLARNTRSAVSGGSLHAAAGFIRHVAMELRSRLGSETRVLLTGGDAERLRPLLSDDFEWRPRLVMEGMRVMAVCAEEKE